MSKENISNLNKIEKDTIPNIVDAIGRFSSNKNFNVGENLKNLSPKDNPFYEDIQKIVIYDDSKTYGFGTGIMDDPYSIERNEIYSKITNDVFRYATENPESEFTKALIKDDPSLIEPKSKTNNIFGDTIAALPENENPFYAALDALQKENKFDIAYPTIHSVPVFSENKEYKEKYNELFTKMEEYAKQNPDSKFAIAFATENPKSDFAMENPDKILNKMEASLMISELSNNKELVNQTPNNVIIDVTEQEIKFGECLNSLPEKDNPFKKDMDKLKELKEEIGIVSANLKPLGKKTPEQIQALVDYKKLLFEVTENIKAEVEKNPNSELAKAYAADNPVSSFAMKHEELSMDMFDMQKFITDNLIEQNNEILNFGDCLNSLPEKENPFAKQYNELMETARNKIAKTPGFGNIYQDYISSDEFRQQLSDLQQKMNDYANENPTSSFALAFATDNQKSDFAKSNPDCVLSGSDKTEFINDSKEASSNTFSSVFNGAKKLAKKALELKNNFNFTETYGGKNRSNELQALTNAMDKAVRKDQAMIMEMKNNKQLLLDPNKNGGLDVYVLNSKKIELLASFDQDGKTNEPDIQSKLAGVANNLAIDNDNFFENIGDLIKDSRVNESKPIDDNSKTITATDATKALNDKPSQKLNEALKNFFDKNNDKSI